MEPPCTCGEKNLSRWFLGLKTTQLKFLLHNLRRRKKNPGTFWGFFVFVEGERKKKREKKQKLTLRFLRCQMLPFFLFLNNNNNLPPKKFEKSSVVLDLIPKNKKETRNIEIFLLFLLQGWFGTITFDDDFSLPSFLFSLSLYLSPLSPKKGGRGKNYSETRTIGINGANFSPKLSEFLV